jgi:hypothetical protein
VTVPRALPVGNDLVYLKGGGIIRGTLIEAIPNDHATVELATGQSAVIPWDRIERIDRSGASSPAPAPVPPPVVAPPRSSGGSAVVHIESDAPVILERRDPGGGRWALACSAPCDEELPLASSYRISGAGVRDSNSFRLNARPGDHIVLDVSTASKGAFAGGIVLTSIGGGSLLLGAMVLMTVAAENASNPYQSSNSDGNAGTVGWIMLGAGAASVLVGVLVIVGNRHSNVGQSTATQHPRNDAWLRLPQWHDDRSGTTLGVPKAIGVPLFETKF